MLCGRASAHARGWITIIVECNEVYNNFVHLIRTNVLHLPYETEASIAAQGADGSSMDALVWDLW